MPFRLASSTVSPDAVPALRCEMRFLFGRGVFTETPPPPPLEECGDDPTDDILECKSFPPCE